MVYSRRAQARALIGAHAHESKSMTVSALDADLDFVALWVFSSGFTNIIKALFDHSETPDNSSSLSNDLIKWTSC